MRVLISSFYFLFSLVSSIHEEYRDYNYDKTFNNFYKLHEAAMTWNDAFLRCEEEGADLMVPVGLDEATAVSMLLRSVPLKYPGAFIGIHSLYSEHTFVTLTGDEVMGSVLELLWEREEPRVGRERCVALRRSGRIFLQPCEKKLPFLCKRASGPVEAETDCHPFDSRWTIDKGYMRSEKNIDSCYFISSEPLKWREAYMSCTVAGGHLVIVNDTTEARFLQGFISRSGKDLPENFAFVGFSDHFLKYHYRTVHGDGLEGLHYNTWERETTTPCSEARDLNASLSLQTRCGGITRSGLLTTASCDVPALYICEKPVVPSYLMREGRTPMTK